MPSAKGGNIRVFRELRSICSIYAVPLIPQKTMRPICKVPLMHKIGTAAIHATPNLQLKNSQNNEFFTTESLELNAE
jgi:hypothetical protein